MKFILWLTAPFTWKSISIDPLLKLAGKALVIAFKRRVNQGAFDFHR